MDWYGKWERQKREQYEAFVKHIEEDPYQALFGASNRWLGWLNKFSDSSPTKGRERNRQARTYSSKPCRDASAPTWHSKDISTRETVNTETPSAANTSLDNDEYDIDPITLRKVARRSPRDKEKPSSSSQDPHTQYNIHIKESRSPSAASEKKEPSWTPSTQADEPAHQFPQSWLSQEGFGDRKPGTEPAWSPTSYPNVIRKAHKIESALDRHLNTPSSKTSPSDDEMSRVKSSRPTVTQKAGKDARSQTLEKRFTEMPSELDRKYEDEIAKDHREGSKQVPGDHETITIQPDSSKVQPAQVSSYEPNVVEDAEGNTQDLSTEPRPTTRLTSDHVSKIRAKLVPLKSQIDVLKEDYASLRQQLLLEKRRIEDKNRKKADQQARHLLELEIRTQKHAMQAIELGRAEKPANSQTSASLSHNDLRGEGDMASNVHEFAGRARWYKRKAPHAKCEMDNKIDRIAREKAFVRELRGIYEDRYGTIDTAHRQPDEMTNTNMLGNKIERDATPSRSSTAISTISPRDRLKTISIADALKVYTNKLEVPTFVTQEVQKALADLDAAFAALEKAKSPTESVLQSLQGAIVMFLSRATDLQATARSIADSSSRISEDTNTVIPSIYRVLAYDNSTQKVTSAKSESQTSLSTDDLEVEKSLTTIEALNRLHNPGKFLPHIISLQGKGYDVVSVARDVAILKKVREPIPLKEDYQGRPNPIDGTTTPEVSAGNFASPTGYVNYGPVIPPEDQAREPNGSPQLTDKVRRQEDVFSGTATPQWQDAKRTAKQNKRRVRRKRALMNMLFGGTVTGAACYVVGMLCEEEQMR